MKTYVEMINDSYIILGYIPIINSKIDNWNQNDSLIPLYGKLNHKKHPNQEYQFDFLKNPYIDPYEYNLPLLDDSKTYVNQYGNIPNVQKKFGQLPYPYINPYDYNYGNKDENFDTYIYNYDSKPGPYGISVNKEKRFGKLLYPYINPYDYKYGNKKENTDTYINNYGFKSNINSEPNKEIDTGKSYQGKKQWKPKLEEYSEYYIPVGKRHNPQSIGSRILGTLGTVDDGTYKEYLFSNANFGVIPGLGELIDHALYEQPSNRSYIPDYGGIMIRCYRNLGSQPYNSVAVNSPHAFKLPQSLNPTNIISALKKKLFGVKDEGYLNSNYKNSLIIMTTDNIEIPWMERPQYYLQYSKITNISKIKPYEFSKWKEDYIKEQQEFTKSISNDIQSRKIQLSNYAKNRKQHESIYKTQIQNPLTYLYGEGDYKTTRSVTLWKESSQQYFIKDPLSFQAESYREFLYPFDETDKEYPAHLNGSKHTDGIVKFWIQDINDKVIMTTPAFISELNDGGLNGQWDQFSHVGGMYPKFIYKGVDKRVISFKLKLGCFDKKYLNQYLEKLNFLRLVGSPTYKTVNISRQYYGSEALNSSQTFSFEYPKAPIYRLTLGDIIFQQQGFFEACDISWPDQQTIWNLNESKLINKSGNNFILQDLLKNKNSDIQIPIITTIDCKFVCMYGKPHSNNDILNPENYIYKYNEIKNN